MKKGFIVLTMLVTFMLAPIVKADTIEAEYPDSQKWLFSNRGDGENASTSFLKPNYINEKYDLDDMYQQIINKYNEEYEEEYPYYIVNFINDSKPNGDLYSNRMYLTMYENEEDVGGNSYDNQVICTYENGTYTLDTTLNSGTRISVYKNPFKQPIGETYYVYSPLLIYDANVDILNDYNSTFEVEEISLVIGPGEEFIPYLETEQTQYIEVNLDNYEYVLLSLKDYNQTQAFQTNLQVKGQIGITPIYNYGQTTKDNITGVKVQDRCNTNYENYTNYPFYVIQQDLQNNVIYAVKKCSTGSSFKFDYRIFNITYITQENKNNPTITINGETYNVIPYDELPSTATKNEEENYIPGESGNANDTGGLDSAIKNAQQKMSEIWNTITYFTDFINQIFSSLPSEIRTILVSAFTIMITIGLIKIFIS